MIVRCPSCEARFHLADGRLPEKGARVRCSKCHHRFYVRPPGADGQGSDAELEAESEPDAAPVSRQGKPAAEGAKAAKAAKTAKAPPAPAKAPAPAAAKPAKPAAPKPAPAAPKPAAAAPKPEPAPKPVPAAKPADRPPAAARSGGGSADDPDLEDPQFLFDKEEAKAPPRAAAKSSERTSSAPSDALAGGAALFSDDDDDERVEATLGDEEAFVDHDARTDLFGDMAGLAAETEAADAEKAAAAKPARASAPAPARPAAPSREEPMPTIGGDSEPAPELDVKPGRSSASYQAGGSREQVERKVAPARPAARGTAEAPAAPPPALDTPRSRLLRAFACVAAVALAVAGGRLVASHASGPYAGPERLAGPGWEIHDVEILRLRAAEGQLVLALRGTLDRSGSAALPVLRATPADDGGKPVGDDTPVSWTWLDGAELAPERLSHWIAAGPAPAPAADAASIASARFTVLIVNPPAAARRILLRAS